MKKVLLALALIIGTSSIADAGELDGKAVWCPDTKRGLVFARDQVTPYFVKGYSIAWGEMEAYYLEGTSEVKWSSNFCCGGTSYLNRETLKSNAYGQCEVSSKKSIMVILNLIIANAKKKNKI
jgi:hypothetical protein